MALRPAFPLNLLKLVPDVAGQLRAIRDFTGDMRDDVRTMSASVQRLETEVTVLLDKLDYLNGRVLEIEQGMARLEPQVADVNLAVRPLRRARARLPNRTAAELRRLEREGGNSPPEV